MGNSAAGLRLCTSDANVGGVQKVVEVEVLNQIGMPMSLESEVLSSNCSMTNIPQSLPAGMSKIQITGQNPYGHVVYSCAVAYRNAAPQKLSLSETNSAMRSGVVDLRRKQTEQRLGVSLSWSSGVWGSSLCFGAAYGSVSALQDVVQEAERCATNAMDNSNGICMWHIGPLEPDCGAFARRVTLELKKTKASVLDGRSAMLDRLQQGSQSSITPHRSGTVVDTLAIVAKAREGGASDSPARLSPSTFQPEDWQHDPRLTPIESVSDVAPRTDAPQASATSTTLAPPSPSQAPIEAQAPLIVAPSASPTLGKSTDSLVVDSIPTTSTNMSKDLTVGTRDLCVSTISSVGIGENISQTRHGDEGVLERLPASQVTDPQKTTILDTETSSSSSRTLASRGLSRSGALALATIAAAELAKKSRLAELAATEEAEAAAEAAARAAILGDRMLRMSQDQEYQQCLLTDQLKEHLAREEALRDEAAQIDTQIEELRKCRVHAEQRLEKFGANPRLEAEVACATEKQVEMQARADELVLELSKLEDIVALKNELLLAMLA